MWLTKTKDRSGPTWACHISRTQDVSPSGNLTLGPSLSAVSSSLCLALVLHSSLTLSRYIFSKSSYCNFGLPQLLYFFLLLSEHLVCLFASFSWYSLLFRAGQFWTSNVASVTQAPWGGSTFKPLNSAWGKKHSAFVTALILPQIRVEMLIGSQANY